MRGWKALIVLLGLITILFGVGAWSFITWVTSLAATTDPIWPDGSEDVWAWVCIGGTIAGIVLGFTLDYSSVWTDRLPSMTNAGSAASTTGVAIGAAAAAVSIATAGATAPAIVVVAIIAVVAAGLAWRKVRTAVRETCSHHRNIERLRLLRATGTRVRAVVEDVEFRQSWLWNEPVFTVTVRYDTPSGLQQTAGRLVTPAVEAPMVGGTVLLWFSGDGNDTSNIDIERDPESILDPDVATTYEAPSDI